jgi:hypothetical protein
LFHGLPGGLDTVEQVGEGRGAGLDDGVRGSRRGSVGEDRGPLLGREGGAAFEVLPGVVAANPGEVDLVADDADAGNGKTGGGVRGVEVGQVALEDGVAVRGGQASSAGDAGVKTILDRPAVGNAVGGGRPYRWIKAVLIFLEVGQTIAGVAAGRCDGGEAAEMGTDPNIGKAEALRLCQTDASVVSVYGICYFDDQY